MHTRPFHPASRLKLTALSAIAALTLAGCSSEADEPAPTEASSTTAAAPQSPGMGIEVKGNGATVTANAAYETHAIAAYTDGSWNSNEARPTEDIEAREGGKYVVIETTVVNDTSSDMDLTCRSTGGWVESALQVGDGVVYQPIDDLYDIPGNPECNRNLGSGFDAEMTWVFLVPDDREPVSFNFKADSASYEEDPAVIVLDKFGEKPEREARGPHPTQDVPADQAEQTPDVVDEPEATAPVPATHASAPAYGATCAESQILQPATGSDGSSLVYAGMGANASPTWVYGPESQGAGTATGGAACTEGEEGGQDEAGRLLMCSNGEWVYGP